MKKKYIKLIIVIYILTLLVFVISNSKDLYENVYKTQNVTYLTDRVVAEYNDFYDFIRYDIYNRPYWEFDKLHPEKSIALNNIISGHIVESSINYEIKSFNESTNSTHVTKEDVMLEINNILSNYKREIFDYKFKIFFQVIKDGLIFSTTICIIIIGMKILQYNSNS